MVIMESVRFHLEGSANVGNIPSCPCSADPFGVVRYAPNGPVRTPVLPYPSVSGGPHLTEYAIEVMDKGVGHWNRTIGKQETSRGQVNFRTCYFRSIGYVGVIEGVDNRGYAVQFLVNLRPYCRVNRRTVGKVCATVRSCMVCHLRHHRY